MSVAVLRADAYDLPLPDASVDLICTSPPYFGLRSYTDGGAHYAGQIGSEGAPAEWLANLVDCTREWVRVLKPEGSIFVNLGDKYSQRVATRPSSHQDGLFPNRPELRKDWKRDRAAGLARMPYENVIDGDGNYVREKSLIGLPWRYALACMDQLGLILRAEIIWAKPNGLPESVTDRVRRSHEQLFHFTRLPRYYSAVDEIREPPSDYTRPSRNRSVPPGQRPNMIADTCNPLGKLPGSVWDIPSQPLTVPESLGVNHFACVDTETEILTPGGWLRHDELTPGDQVAGYDLDTGTARWTDCTAVSRYDYDGDMIAVESRDLSMRLTPNHRTIVQRMDAYTKRRNPVTVVRADELDRYHFVPRSAPWEPSGRFYVGDHDAAVLGWVAAEGWYQGRCAYLSQSLDANAPNVAEIDGLLAGTASVRSERKRSWRGRPWTDVTWKLGPWMASVCQESMPGKLLPWALVMATEGERAAVLSTFIAGDGHRRPDGRISITQKHRHNLDVLQAIAVTLGYKTTLREGGGRFVLYLTEGGRSVTLRGTSGVGSKVRREHYQGTVWCPTTGTGTFIARRNGSVFVTGNSFPMELPRRIILGWSPPGVCTACGQGRRPVATATVAEQRGSEQRVIPCSRDLIHAHDGRSGPRVVRSTAITGYACACPQPDAPTRPAIVVDPFSGTGTTILVASVLGRHGIGTDLSADYCRLAAWRTTDPAERARAMQVPKPPPVPDGQAALFAL